MPRKVASQVTGYVVGMDNEESSMNVNVGSLDRALRIVVGLGLVVLAATGVVGAWGYIGTLVLVTGIVRVCPAYSIIGMNTCRARSSGGKGSGSNSKST
jgi:hypothetical protein